MERAQGGEVNRVTVLDIGINNTTTKRAHQYVNLTKKEA